MPRPFFARVGLFIAMFFSSCVLGMDQARIETRVDDAIAKFGVTGKGVLVAIIDRGIDWQNADFRNADGSTRVAWIYDLTDDSGSNAPANPYHLGTIYPMQQIDAALTYGTNLVTRDAVGHGTTTTGISCGNGRNLWKYRGVAYDATILSVKIVAENIPAHGNQPAEIPFYSAARIPTAIRFTKDRAQELGLPCVMLLNLGSIGGPMDGTSSLCQAIDSAVGPGIPGMVFVTGASDDGGAPNHASGSVSPGSSATIKFHKGNQGNLTFDLWYPSQDQFDVTVQTPSATNGPFAAPASNSGYDTHTTTDFLYYQLGGSANFYGTSRPEREIWIRFQGPVGNYSVQLSARNVTDGHFNASLNPSSSWDISGTSNYFTTYVSPGGTVWDAASASNNICPNDYVHRTQWVDINGISRSNLGQGNIGDLWAASGTGPTYDGRLGVDVSAPGDSVFAAYNTNSWFATFRSNLIQDGQGHYGRANAVSAASPIVTGIIALMLQMNPQLDAPTVKSLLQKSAHVLTSELPNPQWGYGRVDAYAALNLVMGTLPPFSLSLAAEQPVQLLVAPAIAGNNYVLQVSTNLVDWMSVSTNSASTNSILLQDNGPASSARFYRAVRAF